MTSSPLFRYVIIRHSNPSVLWETGKRYVTLSEFEPIFGSSLNGKTKSFAEFLDSYVLRQAEPKSSYGKELAT